MGLGIEVGHLVLDILNRTVGIQYGMDVVLFLEYKIIEMYRLSYMTGTYLVLSQTTGYMLKSEFIKLITGLANWKKRNTKKVNALNKNVKVNYLK